MCVCAFSVDKSETFQNTLKAQLANELEKREAIETTMLLVKQVLYCGTKWKLW